TKATHLYSNAGWDLVDAVKNRQVDVDAVKTAELPAAMQKMTPDQRRAFVDAKAQERARLQSQIQALEQDRRQYPGALPRGSAPDTLDEVMLQGLRDQAACRGFALQ